MHWLAVKTCNLCYSIKKWLKFTTSFCVFTTSCRRSDLPHFTVMKGSNFSYLYYSSMDILDRENDRRMQYPHFLSLLTFHLFSLWKGIGTYYLKVIWRVNILWEGKFLFTSKFLSIFTKRLLRPNCKLKSKLDLRGQL